MLTRTVSRLAERLRRLDVLGPGVAPDDQSDLGNASHSDEHNGQAAQDRSKQEADAQGHGEVDPEEGHALARAVLEDEDKHEQADEQGNDDHHPGPAGAGPPDLELRRRSCRHGRLLITFRSHSGLVMPQSGQR